MKRLMPILVVLSMTLSSIAVVSGKDLGRTAVSSIVTPKLTAKELLGSYFTSNHGQVGDGSVVLYSRDAYFTSSGVLFRLTDGERTQVYKMGFDDARQVVPRGVDRLPFESNFFTGNDPALWRTGIPNYQRIVYDGLYPGIDLAFNAGLEGTKYEFIVHPGGDLKDIKMTFEGAHVTTDGKTLEIETPLGKVVDGGLKVYQDETSPLEARMTLERNVVGYDIMGSSYDGSKDLVIDPLIFSTFFGGNDMDSPYAIALDSSKNMYMTGETISTNFPTTPGAYDTTAVFTPDVFVLALNATGKDLIYSTYYGGNSIDFAYSIALDSNKNAYVCGETYSSNLPTTVGAYDRTFNNNVKSFTFKLNPMGSALVYATYVGGSVHDTANGIVVDGSGNAYVTGYTWSANFPTVSAYSTTNHGNGDVFVYKLNPAGNSLLFSTFIGGSGYDYGNSIAIDGSGNAYVTGKTASNTDFPTTVGAYDTTFNGGQYDIYVLKLNSSGSALDYSTFLGGSNTDWDGRLVIDGSGNAYVAGWTMSDDFPTTAGAYSTTYKGGDEGYLFKLDPKGKALLYSTYIGGAKDDVAKSVAIDSSGNAFVTGWTNSVDFPTSPGAYCTTYNGGTGDVFVFAVNSTGKGLIFSSYIGGTVTDGGEGIALDIDRYVYVTGDTSSFDFPTTAGAFSTTKASVADGFALKLKVPTPPGTVKGLSTTSGDGFVQLNWTRPDSDGGSKITNFKVLKGTSPGSLTLLSLDGNVTTHNDTTVTNGVTYYYAVVPINIMGDGPLSSIVNATPSRIPGAPQGLKVTIGNSYTNLSWSPPLVTGGAAISNYHVYKGSQAGSLSAFKLLGNVTSYNDTTAINGVASFYAVSALNLRGEGPRSTTVKAIPGKVPSAPRNLKAAIGDAYVRLTWVGPLDNGGYNLTTYRVYREGPGSARAIIGEVATLGYNDTAVENGKDYNYSVTALNALGEGPASPVVLARPGRVPGAPTLTAQAGDRFVNLSWTAGVDGGYQVSVFKVYRGVSATAMVYLANATGTRYNDTTVENGKTYQYAVSAMNALGEGPMSLTMPAMPKGLPGRPVNLTAAAGNGFVVLSWLPPTDTGGLAVTLYRVYIGTKATGEDLALLKEVTTLTYNDTKVVNKATYYYAVSGVNDVGEGPRTTLVKATPLGPPGKVQNLLAKGGDGHILLGWAAPADDGGSPILGYKVFKGDTLLSAVNSLALNDTAVKNGVTYSYSVAAFTAAGIGERSTVTATPGASPKAPMNVTTAKNGDGVLLKWSPPQDTGGFPVSGYKVYKGTSQDGLTLVGTVQVPEFLDKDVKGGKTYYYRVSAVNERGEGTRSDVASQKVTATSTGMGGIIYILLAVLIAVIVAVVVAVIILKRRKGRRPEVAPQAPQPQQPAVVAQGQASQQPPAVPPPQGP